MENLKIIQNYVKITGKCQNYLNRIKNANDNFLKSSKITVDHKESLPESNMINEVFNIFQAIQVRRNYMIKLTLI